MTSEELTRTLRQTCGSSLVSVILYGSAAAGDYLPKHSDYNILMVLTRLGVEELKQVAPVMKRWMQDGNPPPRLFTLEGLSKSADVFAIELSDIQESRVVLYGQDVVSELRVARTHLRFQLEHELHSKLLQLRERYLVAAGNPRSLHRLLTKSFSTFLVLCRGALRLYQAEVPRMKLEVLTPLERHLGVNLEVFREIAALRGDSRQPAGRTTEAIFASYLIAIEAVIGAIEHAPRSGGKDGGT